MEAFPMPPRYQHTLAPQNSMGSYDLLSDASNFQDQKRDIAELKITPQYILSQVENISAPVHNNPPSTPCPETIKINAGFGAALYMVLDRIETPLIRDSVSARYAQPILNGIVEKYGELSEADRSDLARVIGRFEVTREYHAAGSEANQSYRGAIFTLCVKELRELLGC
ncbi:hypothetical protein IAR50_005710 [Cryptococcus sp. DSM 104548]